MRGLEREQERRRLGVVEGVGRFEDRDGVGDGVVGDAAERILGDGDDALAQPPFGALAGCVHHAAHIHAECERWGSRQRDEVASAAVDVVEVERCRGHLHSHLVRPGLGTVDGAHLQHFAGRAVTGHLQGLHVCHAPSFASLRHLGGPLPAPGRRPGRSRLAPSAPGGSLLGPPGVRVVPSRPTYPLRHAQVSMGPPPRAPRARGDERAVDRRVFERYRAGLYDVDDQSGRDLHDGGPSDLDVDHDRVDHHVGDAAAADPGLDGIPVTFQEHQLRDRQQPRSQCHHLDPVPHVLATGVGDAQDGQLVDRVHRPAVPLERGSWHTDAALRAVDHPRAVHVPSSTAGVKCTLGNGDGFQISTSGVLALGNAKVSGGGSTG